MSCQRPSRARAEHEARFHPSLHCSLFSLVVFLLLCILAVVTSGCVTQDASVADSGLVSLLNQARDEVSWEHEDALAQASETGRAFWSDYERYAIEEWRTRSSDDALARAVASYESAYEELARDETLSPAEYRRTATRHLLRSAHGYYLLGFMHAPVWRGEAGARKRRADALLACRLGARRAKEALTLYHDEVLVQEMLERPTPRKLNEVQEKTALHALQWYALNTQCEMEMESGRRRVKLQPVVAALLEELSLRGLSSDYGMVHGAIGSYYAQHGQGGSNSKKSREHFAKGLDMWPNNLMLHVLYAEHYATAVQDAMLFDRELETVLRVPSDLVDELREENKIALARAKRLVEAREELFY